MRNNAEMAVSLGRHAFLKNGMLLLTATNMDVGNGEEDSCVCPSAAG